MRIPALKPPAMGSIPLGGGVDIVTPTIATTPGSLRYSNNYEAAIGGGYRRILGFERFDGRPSPSDAVYALLTLDAPPANVTVGDTVAGETSAATGVVFRIDGNTVAVTKITGAFEVETLKRGVNTVGDIVDPETAVDGFLDNVLNEGAANEYRADIAAVPGVGPIRGLAILNGVVYAWRDNVGVSAMVIHKSTVGGWSEVAMYHEVNFDAGTAAYTEGASITQGAVSATVKRVVLLSGSWAGGTAAGKLIVTVPSGGVFAAGAAAGGGAANLTGGDSLITLSPGGMVSTVSWNFYGGAGTQRLYGCDGTNREFEFDGDVWVPLSTGMGAVRASRVVVHKNHLFFSYGSSVQHSSPGAPYLWSPIVGAAELGTGDDVTDMVSIGGSEAAAALMILCKNSTFVLYGNGVSSWNLSTMSRTVGCSRGSAQDIGGVVALDRGGVGRFPATQAFGNFLQISISQQVEPLVKARNCDCSVYTAKEGRYRVFFSDSTAISGLPAKNGRMQWMPIDYGRSIKHAVDGEIAGDSRTFYGTDDGWVIEADKGRSFDGQPIPYSMVMSPVHFRTPSVLKSFRYVELEFENQSACSVMASAEIENGGEYPQSAAQVESRNYGVGLVYGRSLWGQSYWNVKGLQHRRLPMEAVGASMLLTFSGESSNELPHTIRMVTVAYHARRVTR